MLRGWGLKELAKSAIHRYLPGMNTQILSAVAGLILGYWLNGNNAVLETRNQILYVLRLIGLDKKSAEV